MNDQESNLFIGNSDYVHPLPLSPLLYVHLLYFLFTKIIIIYINRAIYITASCLGIIVSGLIWLLRGFIVGLFTSDMEVIREGKMKLLIIVVLIVMKSITNMGIC